MYSFFPQFSEEGQAGLVRIQEFLEDAPELYAGFEGELEGWVNQGATELEGMDGNGLELPPPEAVMDSMWKGRIDPSSAQILIQPLTSGGYGIALQDSAFDVETAGKGVRVKPVPRIREQASFETLKKDLVANLRSAVEGFGTRFMAEFVRFIRSLVTGLLGALVGLTLTFMVAGFLLLEMPEIRNWARRTIPSRFHMIRENC